jgi:ABC-type multidrug transport system fused ATPase/permease subunit
MPRPASTKTAQGRSVRSLTAPLVRAQRGRLTRMSLAAIAGGFAEAFTLVLIARIAFALGSDGSDVKIDVGAFGTMHVAVSALIALAGLLVIVRIVLQSIYSVLAARATFTVIDTTRTSLTRLYLAAGWPLQASQREGRLQELLTTYTGSAASALNSLTQAGISGFNLFALLLTALFVSPVASIAAAFVALGMGLLLKPLRAAGRRRSGRAAQANLDFATGLTELASTLQEVKVFGVEDEVNERLGALNRRSVTLGLHTTYANNAVGVVYQGAALLLLVGALGLARAAGFSQLSSLGAVVLIMLRSLNYAQSLQTSIQGVHQNAPYIEALNEEEDRYRASAMQHGGQPVGHIDTIKFDDVSFEYETGTPVLHDFSFQVPRGEIVGIVGPSGSGKSTLIQLILRLREPTTGTMYVGERDVRDLSLDEWYRRVTFVPQDPHLFAGTVSDNIRFFRTDVDSASITRAAKLAHIHDDIVSWPLGYDTPVGERGGQLSGGQRQRLCIARALVEDPEIIVLDEPTSALDVRSEHLIRETIADLAPQTTVFVIAHRLSTLSICDRIMVILNGALEGFDASSTLEASNPFYQEALRLSGMRG